MRATVRKMIAILDGTPTGTRGQSLVELTLTLPILLVMLLGLTEIGWFANSYLTLLDVVREAGRYGASRDPMVWVDGEEKNYHRLDCEALSDKFNKLKYGEDNSVPIGPTDPYYKYFIGVESSGGYYDGVACTVIGNMAPLEFKDDKDDVVVSVFGYMILDRASGSPSVRVYGRYPSQANECENDDINDPFDWNRNGKVDTGEDGSRFDATSDNVRGFVFRGNHKMDYGGGHQCLGSAFSTTKVEEMLNFKDDPDRIRKLKAAPNFGLVLVEVFWEHQQLLGMKWFNMGPMDEALLIHVWTFFPVSAAEPDLD